LSGVNALGPFVEPVLTVEAGVVGVAGEEPKVALVDNEELDPFVGAAWVVDCE
jgi:hypothetical protein